MTDTDRDAVIDALLDEFLFHAPRGRRLLAVDGADAAGKSTFADALGARLAARGHEVVRASIDDFERPRAERYARGRYSAFGCYHDTFDYGTFRSLLVEPFRSGGRDAEHAPFTTAAFDLVADAPADLAPRTAGADAVLVVDGVFLNRPELRGIWHFSVWLDVEAPERARRLAERDGLPTDPGDPLVRRYAGAHELYLDDAHPNTAATAIIDNTDPRHPKRRFADYCVAPPRTR
jgi:uridine kinase